MQRKSLTLTQEEQTIVKDALDLYADIQYDKGDTETMNNAVNILERVTDE